MNFLRDVIQPLIIRNTARKSFNREVKLQNFDDIQSVCIVAEINGEPDSANILQDISNHYKRQGKAVDIIVFYPSSDLPAKLTASSFWVIKKNELNFLGLLKRPARKSLSEKKYDLAVCYNPGNMPAVTQAVAIVRARFKAGTPGAKGYVPEMVLHAKKEGIMHFIETINNYLRKLNQSS